MPTSETVAGPATLIDVATARRRVIARAQQWPRRAETLPLDCALDRALHADVHAPMNVPAFANSAMDGFALRGQDLPPDGEARFALIGTRLAGDGRDALVGPGECLRITTGAPLPRGADTVVIKENVRVDGDAVVVSAGETAGANTRAAGEDYRRDDLAFAAGTVLTPARLGVLASFGLTEVRVAAATRAVLLTTGDEIVAPGQPLRFGEIYNSNRYGLGALLRRHGVELLRAEHVRDDRDALRAALQRAAAEADLVLSSGGVSAGEADFLPQLLTEIGIVDFWKVRMKPGMPLLFGSIGETLVFSLPGNPVSGMATFLTLVRPALEVRAGRDPLAAPRWHARLAQPLRKNHRRAEFQRAARECRDDGTLWVTPFAHQGSGVLRSVAEADCLIVLPEETQSLQVGDVVEILPLT